MTTNKIPEYTDHNGAIMVIVAKGEAPAVYIHRRLSDRAGNGSTCEGCEYRFSKHDAQRIPMYDSVAMHDVDGFGDWLTWCQVCLDTHAAAEDADGYYWYTGQYGNGAAPTTRKVRHHVR
jgi:hypothetical protein